MILIGLGANLDSVYGAPEQSLKACVRLLEEHKMKVLEFSSIWISAPVPVSDQPWYHNAVCSVGTSLSAQEILAVLSKIEKSAGRERHTRNEARVLDLDLLIFHDEIIEAENLIVPHPRMHERAFVLYPLHEIAPNWIHPVLDQSLDQMIKAMPQGQKIKRLDKAA